MAGDSLGCEGHGTSGSTACPVPCLCLFVPLQHKANGDVTLLGTFTALPSVIRAGLSHRSPFPWLLRQLWAHVSESSILFASASCQCSPTERSRTEHLDLCLCCFYLFLTFQSLFLECRSPCADILFIKYVQERAQGPVPPSRVGCGCPASRSGAVRQFLCRGVGRRKRKERAERETSKDVSKYLQVPG